MAAVEAACGVSAANGGCAAISCEISVVRWDRGWWRKGKESRKNKTVCIVKEKNYAKRAKDSQVKIESRRGRRPTERSGVHLDQGKLKRTTSPPYNYRTDKTTQKVVYLR